MPLKGKVLIIDDEPDLLETMSYRLSTAGYDIMTALDGATGLNRAAQDRPDLVILDVMMPGADGFEILKKLKETKETRDIPVIVFSCGRQEEEWAKRSLSLGASGYIVKPFESDALLFTVDKFVKRRRKG
ncbi:MAG: response regulator [Candidatus Omnitrophota bacterium]